MLVFASLNDGIIILLQHFNFIVSMLFNLTTHETTSVLRAGCLLHLVFQEVSVSASLLHRECT